MEVMGMDKDTANEYINYVQEQKMLSEQKIVDAINGIVGDFEDNTGLTVTDTKLNYIDITMRSGTTSEYTLFRAKITPTLSKR